VGEITDLDEDLEPLRWRHGREALAVVDIVAMLEPRRRGASHALSIVFALPSFNLDGRLSVDRRSCVGGAYALTRPSRLRNIRAVEPEQSAARLPRVGSGVACRFEMRQEEPAIPREWSECGTRCATAARIEQAEAAER